MIRPSFYVFLTQYVFFLVYTILDTSKEKDAIRIVLQVTNAILFASFGIPPLYALTLALFIASLAHDNLGLHISTLVISVLTFIHMLKINHS